METDQETFSDFKNSFSYGSRTDLNFKFLKSLSDADAAAFFQDLLWKIGDAYDRGDFTPVLALVQQTQARAYAGATRWQYDEGPFTPLKKPTAAARLTLITSTGHFVEGEDPQPFGMENMTQDEAIDRIDDFLKTEPSLSAIPMDTPAERLRVRHGGYDIRGVQADPNVALPLEHLRELAAAGRIGELTANAFSFVGACAQTRLLKRTGPRWVAEWQSLGIDGAILVPV
jgi:hypothetical protein